MPATSSVIRHLLTYLAGLGGLLLSWHLIAADQVPAVDAAAMELVTPLSVILGAVVAGITRLLMAWVGKFFRRVPGSNGNGLGAGMLLVWIGTAAGFLFSLPSCSPATLAVIKAVPIKACYIDPLGNSVCYSSTTGMEVTVDQRSAK